MEIAIPNLRHLRVFLAVAELKSITRASENIFLSQPAITQAIAKLEGLTRRAPSLNATQTACIPPHRVRYGKNG